MANESTSSDDEVEKRFEFLRVLSRILVALALLSGAVGGLRATAELTDDLGGETSVGVLVISGTVGVVVLFLLASQFIKVLLAIEENTRRASRDTNQTSETG